MMPQACDSIVCIGGSEMQIMCPCGEVGKWRGKPFRNTGSVGEATKKTGFTFMMIYGGDSLWLCPECADKVQKLAQGILEIVKNDGIYFPHLLKGRRNVL